MNFDFLKPLTDWKKLYDKCAEAEEFVLSKPNISVAYARKALESIVKHLYEINVGPTYGFSLFDLMDDYRFQDYINDETLMRSMHIIRKNGNIGVHEDGVSQKQAMDVLEQLHFVTGEFCINLGLIQDYPEFVKPTAAPARPAPVSQPAVVPVVPIKPSAPSTPAVPSEAADVASQKVEVEPEIVAKYGPRMRQVHFDVKHKRNEEENKKLYMEACLREAGWPVVSKPDVAMPCSAGINMILDNGDTVDYILYGRDNRPLALVEYSATVKNLIDGRNKGIAKANQLEVKYGYKPVVYYTNGYYIFIIDQLGYKPRRVFQFHSMEELELLKQRANSRQDISNPTINDNITNRDYQKQAIKAACKAFTDYRRHALLVMATGTGKTRVSISLSDVLLKAGWVKNILFLADRTSLVRQAHKNFTKLLPSVTTTVYSGGSMQRDPNARIVFSTYQTMINLINDDTREFSIGRFDLIIIDEAHRSIFKKYSALFHYFDALMIGLTATPRAEDNKSTYEMFQLENGNPDYAYELEQAIADGYLVGFNVQDKTTDAMRRGIHYDELTEEEKQSIEDEFASGDTPAMDTIKKKMSGIVISASDVKSRRYINIGTIDAMLNDLVKNGIKIEGGDKLGKTIIFSSTHEEATVIVERFQTLYPHMGQDFCKLIDSQIVNNLSLIDNFGERDRMPQVAVSVDMLDTGIDVPDILNLVFFKKVNSKIKFLQMAGRGTRLSPDVFGPGMDKQGFLIFDYYDNFRYFRAVNTWSTVDGSSVGPSWIITPQSVLINETKLGILSNLINSRSNNTFEEQYKEQLKQEFIRKVQGLCNDDIEVQYNMSYVSKYRTAEQWNTMSKAKADEIKAHILPLLPSETDPVKVKTFDLLIYVIEDEVPKREAAEKDIRKIRHGFGNVGKLIDKMMEELLKLKTIPAIVKKETLINQMRNADLIFNNFSLENCEKIRKELRDLMAYIKDDKKYHIINVSDFVLDSAAVKSGLTREKQYPEKVNEYLNSDDPKLAKIRNLDELTQPEKDDLNDIFTSRLGSAADYAAWAGNKPLLPHVRALIGIADEAIQTKFGSFLNSTELNPAQLTYMNQIINYVKSNGDIVFLDLQSVSPFCDVDVTDLFGEKVVHIKTLINGLHKPVM